MVVMGRNSVSFSESSPRSSLTPARPVAYSSLSSFLATASSSPSNSSLAVSRHAPKWYSSKTTRSQLTTCSHSFLGLMLPAVVPAEQILERAEVDERAPRSRRPVGSVPDSRERYCQPSKSTWDSRSVCHASSTAGLKVTTSTAWHRASWRADKWRTSCRSASLRSTGTAGRRPCPPSRSTGSRRVSC